MRARLEEHGVAPEAAATVVAELEDVAGIDDARYARVFAEDKRALDGWGAERIRAALAARGVAESLIDQALAGISNEGEIERAIALLELRAETPADEASRGRAYGFLVRRGYPSEIAYDAIRRAESGGG